MLDALFFQTITEKGDLGIYCGKESSASPVRDPGFDDVFYTPDLSRPVYDENRYREARFRATWQVIPKDKIVGMFGYEWNCNCPGSYALGATVRSPEAAVGSDYRPNCSTR